MIDQLKRVDSSQKKRIIEVSVDRLYNTALKGTTEYGFSRDPYESNTQRYAEEKFMNSLRSDAVGESSYRGTKSQTRVGISPEKTAIGSPFQSSYKPKLTQIKYGLVERPKQKFVKKVDSLYFAKSYTAVNLKTAETSKEHINTSHFHEQKRFSNEVSKPKLPTVHLVMKGTTSATKDLRPGKYKLQNESSKPLKKTDRNKKWTFEDYNAKVSVEKSQKRESSKTRGASTSKSIARSTSKNSNTSKIVSTKLIPKEKKQLEKSTSLAVSVKPSVKHISKVERSTSSTIKKDLSEERSSVKSTRVSEKLTSVQVTTITTSTQHKETSSNSTIAALRAKLEGVEKVTIEGNDLEPLHTSQLNTSFKPLKSLTPVKPSNIMPAATNPDTLEDTFSDLLRIKAFEPTSPVLKDQPARCESPPKPHESSAPAPQEIKTPEEPTAETEPQDIEVPVEDEDFEFEDEEEDINAVLGQTQTQTATEHVTTTTTDHHETIITEHVVLKQRINIEVTEVRTDKAGHSVVETVTQTFEEVGRDLSPIGDEEEQEFDFGDDEVDVNAIVHEIGDVGGKPDGIGQADNQLGDDNKEQEHAEIAPGDQGGQDNEEVPENQDDEAQGTQGTGAEVSQPVKTEDEELKFDEDDDMFMEDDDFDPNA